MILATRESPVKLGSLLAGMQVDPGVEDVEISSLALDSREVKPGSLFLAVPGVRTHGAAYIDEALEKGVRAVLVDQSAPAISTKTQVPVLRVDQLLIHLSEIAARFFGQPSSALWVAGITGTNGKTSCAWWLQQLLNLSGVAAASLGTLGRARETAWQPEVGGLTTADPVQVQKSLSELRDCGVEAVAMEVSSHGLAQHRVDAVQFDLAIFTNLSRDHLDYHGDMASYADAKARLFHLPGIGRGLLNVDDPFGARLAADLAGAMRVYSYSLEDSSADFCLLSQYPARGIKADVRTPQGAVQIVNETILGRHNLANLIAVLAAATIKGVDPRRAAEQLSQLTPVPGRLQLVSSAEDDIRVVVDYAHTPDAVAKSLDTLREHERGQILALLGAGGDRDRDKRPLMASAAARRSDFLVLTSDNPRHEDPEAILADMYQGLDEGARYTVVVDRAEAIRAAVLEAKPGDCLAILGKGHEDYQQVGDQRFPFSDEEHALRALQQRREVQQ